MKTQLGILSLFITLLLVACYPKQYQLSHLSNQPSGNSQSQFKGKYSEFIDSTETIIAEWYHYVISQDKDGKYIERRFFPETHTITSEVRYNDKNLDIKDGLATYWYDHGDMSKQGNYIGGEEDGSWSYYHRSTGKLSETGNYILGDKIGNWKSYDAEGWLRAEKTYVANEREGKFITYDSLNTIINEGIYKADTIFQQSNIPKPLVQSGTLRVVEEMPRFYDAECEALDGESKEKNICAQGKMLSYIYQNLRYPSDAREYGIEGMVVIQYVVDTTGYITDIKTLKGICQSLQDTSESVVKSMPKWVPGMQRGRKVKVKYTLPIRYKLEG